MIKNLFGRAFLLQGKTGEKAASILEGKVAFLLHSFQWRNHSSLLGILIVMKHTYRVSMDVVEHSLQHVDHPPVT